MAEILELLTERDDGLVVLRLNRPTRLNALGGSLLGLLDQEVNRAVSDSSVRAIMITGVGRAFCAGGDIGTMGGPANPDATQRGMDIAHGWLRALRGSDKIVLTAINGAAAGGGFGLAMLGDVVVASTAAFFKAGFTELGVAADYGLGWTLPRAVGESRAAEIIFSDRRVSAEEALRLGIVGRLIEADVFEAEALAFARKLAGVPFGAKLTKRLLRMGEAGGFAAYLAAEARAQVQAFQSEDFREGVAAFREKRAGRFVGR